MVPDETAGFVGSGEEKPEPRKLNRAEKRSLAKDLRLARVRATMPDMANSYRAKRQDKRQAANKTRNRNRRLAKR